MPRGFTRGDRVTIISGRYAGQHGLVDSNVFQKTADYPKEYARGCHVVLDDGQVVTVRWDQVKCRKQESATLARRPKKRPEPPR